MKEKNRYKDKPAKKSEQRAKYKELSVTVNISVVGYL